MALAFTQRLAGDTAGAKITAEQARNTLERFCRDEPDNIAAATALSQAYAVMGDKDSALKLAERAIMLATRCERCGDGTPLRREPGVNSDDVRRE